MGENVRFGRKIRHPSTPRRQQQYPKFGARVASRILLSLLGLLGLNGAFIFGYTLRMDLGVKTLIDARFLAGLSTSFLIFVAGISVFIGIWTGIFAAVLASHQNRESSKQATSLSKFLASIAPILLPPLTVFMYLLVASQFLSIWSALLYICFVLFFFIGSALLAPYDFRTGLPLSGQNRLIKVRAFIRAYIDWRSSIKSVQFIKLNVALMLVFSLGLGDARYISVSSSLDYCLKMEDQSLRVGLLGQSSEYIFFANGSRSPFRTFEKDPILIVKKDQVNYLGFDWCT